MEPVSMVIKVKCGVTMRRFRARIVDGEFELSIRGLKQKIISLFGLFAKHEHLVLTYIDEDGDVVHLLDVDDLRDVVEQGLNPLRITAVDHHSSGSSSLLLPDTKADPKSICETVAATVSTDLTSLVSCTTQELIELELDHYKNKDYLLIDHYKNRDYSFVTAGRKTQPERVNHLVVQSEPSILHEPADDQKVWKDIYNLNSCLVEDFTLDATITSSPSTPFKKIWRMRNNGRVEWPHKTELIWLGGDRLSNQSSFEVQLPAAGLPVDKEVDIIVDLTAPAIPDEYVAFWMLISPTGERFGEPIQVIVKVEDSDEDVSPAQPVPASRYFSTGWKRV